LKAGKKFSVKAVLIGWVVDIGGSLGVGFLVGVFAGIYLIIKGVSPDRMEEAIYSSFGFLLTSLIIGLFFTGLGGYIAAKIAKTAELKHAFVVGLLSALTGMLYIVLSSNPGPPSFNIVGLTLVIPIAVLGGYLAKP
jgi:hypothetical protein